MANSVDPDQTAPSSKQCKQNDSVDPDQTTTSSKQCEWNGKQGRP